MYYYVHRLVASEGTQKANDGAWSLDFCLSICMRKTKSFSAEILQVLPEMSSLQLPSQNPKKSVVVLSFLGPLGRICCKVRMPSKGDRDTMSAMDLAVSIHGYFPNTHLQRWPDARFGAIMQVSSLLVSHFELLLYSLKGQSHISCPQCKITSDM